MKANLTPEDKAAIANAKWQMENIGWAMEGLNKMGNVIENRVALLPEKQREWIQDLSNKVLMGVVKSNLLTMKPEKINTLPWNKTYKALVTTSGAIGGAFGAATFAADLTLATKFMMRSIMDIAREQGEDLNELDTQLACLQVFALGGKTKHDAGIDTGYYASRIATQSAVKGGVKSLESLLKGTTTPLLKFISQIAARFSIQVSEKFVAQAIPVIGAAGGAAINLAFITHFQNMAKAHFTIRKLERKYGEARVKKEFLQVSM